MVSVKRWIQTYKSDQEKISEAIIPSFQAFTSEIQEWGISASGQTNQIILSNSINQLFFFFSAY